MLYQKTNDDLRQLANLIGGCGGATRKDDLVRCIHRAVMVPESLAQLWSQLDELSQKAVAAAYHNDGEFNATAFVAQYGRLPERPQSRWSWRPEPILIDLFIYNGTLPSDLRPLLEKIVPPPEKFQLQGLTNTPPVAPAPGGGTIDLICAETEQAGLHDLVAYLRLADQGHMKITSTSSRATLGSIKKIVATLLNGDFLPLPASGNYRANQTIRPFGLDVFAQEAGLATKARGRSELQLTTAGREFYQTRHPEILLEAFETWTQRGSFDELSRISGLKGQKARGTRLTQAAARREAVIEALSWCPVGVWIDIQDLYRALKIWHFDFEVETTDYSNLYIGYKDGGLLYGDTYWAVVKGLYVNTVLWEYLGSLGALDLLYTYPEEADYAMHAATYYYYDEPLSAYDGLKYFRINSLGAYLLGQAGEYVPTQPQDRAIFSVSADLSVTVSQPETLTPNDQSLLEQMALPLNNNRYRLDTQRLLTSLEEGGDLAHLSEFLRTRHAGPLPAEASAWLEKVQQNSQVFKRGESALFIKVKSADLMGVVLADPVLRKFCQQIDQKTLVIPANKERAFQNRLRELEYILA